MPSRILVVEDNEDNEDNQKLVGYLLQDEGYDYEVVASGEEALETLDRSPFDLVLMDISLPGIDGNEATRRLRADPRFETLPIFAITAHAIDKEAQSIHSSGVNELITKPIDDEHLCDCLKHWLSQMG